MNKNLPTFLGQDRRVNWTVVTEFFASISEAEYFTSCLKQLPEVIEGAPDPCIFKVKIEHCLEIVFSRM